MGNSMMIFKKKTFWLHDFYLEPILFFVSKLLTNKIENKAIESEHIEWFKIYNSNLQGLFLGASDGALDLELDILNENEYRINVMKDLLNSTYAIFNSIDVDFKAEQFDGIDDYEFGNYANWSNPINTKILSEKILEILAFISAETN